MATRNIRYQPQNFGQGTPYDGGMASWGTPVQNAQPQPFLPIEDYTGYPGNKLEAPVADWSAGFGQQGSGGFSGAGLPEINPSWKPWDTIGADGTRTLGAVSTGLGAFGSAMSGLMAMRNYGLQKDSLNMQREFANKNYAAQRSTTNSNLRDRQAARVASNPGAYQSVGDYMNKNGIA